ncbi:unnamed protein product [Urochloa decumbens]|uniref:Uncharacterized protein n=1 Tax=Urochloa decumbens TaxID=240449 RepID=A0ABC8ZDL3_9POAL
MADKEDKKLAAPLPPPVAVEDKKRAAPLFPLPAVQLVCLWALLTAAVMSVVFAVIYVLDQGDIDLPSWVSRYGGMFTDAGIAELGAIIEGWKWCSVGQSAAAALALLLPARRRLSRRALACVALAAAATNHLMVARVNFLFLTADPGWIPMWVSSAVNVYYLGKGDLYCLMALLGREDRQYEVLGLLKF